MHLTDEFLKEIWCEAFAKNGKGWLRVTTGSMEPLVKPGEMILIEKVQPRYINFGDIIVFEVHGLFVAHRVIKRYFLDGQLFFLQRGDKGGQVMEIPEDWVIGKVIAIEKINGFLIKLDEGLGKYANYVFGYFSYLHFFFYNFFINKLKIMPKIHYLKGFYCLFKKPFNLFYQSITVLLIIAVWLRQRWGSKKAKARR